MTIKINGTPVNDLELAPNILGNEKIPTRTWFIRN